MKYFWSNSLKIGNSSKFQTYQIVGVDEADIAKKKISPLSLQV
jgi:transcription elongation factor GreB